MAARFVAMAVFAPLGGVLADRMSRKAFMIASDAIRAGLIGGAAVVVVTDGPALAVYGLAVVAAIVGAPYRAAQAGLLPQLVDSPEDLTAANAVTSNLESVMMFAGPALAGILIGLWDVEAVFWLNTATFGWSLLLLLRVRIGHPAEHEPVADQAGEPATKSGFGADLIAGFALVARNRDLRNVSLIAAATGFAWGGLTVYMVLLAIRELESGPEGVGYLNAVIGAATVVGGLVVLGRLKSAHLGQFMVVGALGWGLPLLVLAAWPSPVTVIAAVAVIGLSDPIGGLGMDTIPQRVAPAEFISRIFGAIESALVAAMSVGAALAPVLVDELGLRTALGISGGLVVLVGLTRLPAMRRLDRVLEAPDSLEPLRAVPIFADLSPAALEKLAHAAERIHVPQGSTILAEGDSSDRFYLIVSGGVEVVSGDRVLRKEGPGEFFGEIGLLRDVPRTATVSATQDSELLVVDRADFLGAVSHLGDSRAALDELVVWRLAA
jgi:MFS family permease